MKVKLQQVEGSIADEIKLTVTIGSDEPIANKVKVAEAVLDGLIIHSHDIGLVNYADANEGKTSLISVEFTDEDNQGEAEC